MTGRGGGPNRAEAALGRALEWAIQRWVLLGGRRVRPGEAPWLEGPVGGATIGPGVYAAHAAAAGLVLRDDPAAGILPAFADLAGPGFDPALVAPAVRAFYERTGAYRLGVRAAWRGPLRPFARTLILLVSRHVGQLNLPLSPAEAAGGMTSEVVVLADPATGARPFTGWLRRSRATGAVAYAGFYAVARPPGHRGPCVKVVFPLPGGSATVLLRPEHGPGGSLVLVSAGRRFGDPGYYRLHRAAGGGARVRYVPIREEIRVFVDGAGALRAAHAFAFGRRRFLALDYAIEPAADGP